MHDILPFSKYTDVRLPPRVRNVLEGVYQAGWRVLEPVLQKALADYEQALFRRADKAANHQQQNDCFIAMREVRKRATEMEVAFRDALQQRLVGLAVPALSPAPERAQANTVLKLVDSEDLEESLVLSELSAKAEMRYAQRWHLLGYRLAVVAGAPPLDTEMLPLGPHALADALRDAGRRLDLPIDARVDFLRALEGTLLDCMGSVLQAVEQDLIARRVLPNLHLPRARAATAREQEPQLPPQSAPARDQGEPATPTADAAAHDHRPAPGRAMPEHPLAGAFAPPEAALDTPAPGRAATPDVGEPLPAPPAAAAALPASAGPALRALQQVWSEGAGQAAQSVRGPLEEAADSDQSELFETLRELLAGRRLQAGDRPARAGEKATPATVAPAADVQGVLSVLQGQVPTPRMVDGRWQPRRVADIKQDMLSQLRALGDGAPTRLAPEDEDTIDLVGMLFDQLGSGLSPVSLSHSLLTKLQVPVLKVALHDKRFFTQRKHPARLLLNEIAEAAALWVEDEESDRPVLDKMQLVVDRVLRDYDQDQSLFDDLLKDLGGHLGAVRRKADIAERRQVDAARGREKMDLSRAAATEAIEQRLLDHELPEPLRRFLLEAWSDVLALSLLREGPDGADFRHELALADRLIALASQPAASAAVHRAEVEKLLDELRDGVAAVGMQADDFRTVRQALLASIAPDRDQPEAPPSAALEQTLKARPRLGGDSTSEQPATILGHLRGTERWELSGEEQAMVDRIKQLPFGTWFEFVRNQQGDRVRRKLSWFSPVTGRCLFVTARGVKAEDRTIAALARDLVRGNARVVVETRERLIDRAWKAIVSAFRSTPTDPDVALLEETAFKPQEGAA